MKIMQHLVARSVCLVCAFACTGVVAAAAQGLLCVHLLAPVCPAVGSAACSRDCVGVGAGGTGLYL